MTSFDLQALQYGARGPIVGGRTFDRLKHDLPLALTSFLDRVSVAIASPLERDAEIARLDRLVRHAFDGTAENLRKPGIQEILIENLPAFLVSLSSQLPLPV